jgi:hypothetical protein
MLIDIEAMQRGQIGKAKKSEKPLKKPSTG